MLVLGESGSGKTRLMASLLKEAASIVDPQKITILDFAPRSRRVGGVGMTGKIADIYRGVRGLGRYCSPAFERLCWIRFGGYFPVADPGR